MWTNAQRDGRPAEYRWRPVVNAAKFGSRPLLDCRAVTLPIIDEKKVPQKMKKNVKKRKKRDKNKKRL